MTEPSVNRRTLVRAGTLGFAMLGLASQSAGAASSTITADAITGGGVMQAGGGPAEFSVFGASFLTATSDAPRFAGSLSFSDVVAKTIVVSVSISAFGPVEGSAATTRQMSGIATVDGAGAHPFDVILTDGGPIGSGLDRFELRVGADGASATRDPIYEVQSAVQAGNLQLLSISIGDESEASPTPAG